MNIEIKINPVQVENQLKYRLDKIMTIACENIISETQHNLIYQNHVDTGYLLDSFEYRKYSDNSWKIWSNAPYSSYIEFGTRPHDIFAVRANALRWTDSSNNVHFAKKVHHPGTKPSPFFEPSLLNVMSNLPELFKRIK